MNVYDDKTKKIKGNHCHKLVQTIVYKYKSNENY